MRIIIRMFWKSIQGDTYPFMLYIDLPPATHRTWKIHNPENLVSLCFLAVHGIEIKSIYSHKGTTTECVKSVKELSDQSMPWTLGWSFLMLCARVAAFWDQNRSSKVAMTTTWKAWKVSNHGVWDVTRQLKNMNTYLVRGWIGALIHTLFNKVEVVQNAGSQSIVAKIWIPGVRPQQPKCL